MNYTTPLLAALAGATIVGTALAGNAQGLTFTRVAIESHAGVRAVVECQTGALTIFMPDGSVRYHNAENGSNFHQACVLFNTPLPTPPQQPNNTYQL